MTSPDIIRLVPLACASCRQPILAQADEVAWWCETCQKGNLLGDDGIIRSLDIFYSPAIPQQTKGRPFWVSIGQVQITQRDTYKGNASSEAAQFWGSGRLFLVPAFQLRLEELVSTGVALLRNPSTIPSHGSPVPFLPVVTSPEDILPLAEFIVLAVEADRRDALKTVHFQLVLQKPQLWVLP